LYFASILPAFNTYLAGFRFFGFAGRYQTALGVFVYLDAVQKDEGGFGAIGTHFDGHGGVRLMTRVRSIDVGGIFCTIIKDLSGQ